MTELSKVGAYSFMAETFHCDFSKRLFYDHLVNYMLNAADFHSTDRQFGMLYLNTIQKTWVLSRFAIEMAEMPLAHEKFSVETWVESAMRYFTHRNFRMVGEDGKVYGYARSIWAMIDTETRQPTDILAIHDGLIQQYTDKEKECPIDRPSRVQMGDGELVATVMARYSDIDVNGHVNSAKYIQHVLDTLPMEWYAQYMIQRMEVAYVAEAHNGDTLKIYSLPDEAGQTIYFRMTKQSPDDATEAEVCRIMVKYVKEKG